jgi:hypothetical protein
MPRGNTVRDFDIEIRYFDIEMDDALSIGWQLNSNTSLPKNLVHATDSSLTVMPTEVGIRHISLVQTRKSRMADLRPHGREDMASESNLPQPGINPNRNRGPRESRDAS